MFTSENERLKEFSLDLFRLVYVVVTYARRLRAFQGNCSSCFQWIICHSVCDKFWRIQNLLTSLHSVSFLHVQQKEEKTRRTRIAIMATFQKIKRKISSKFNSSNPFPLLGLPDLVLLHVAEQLPTDDARNLSLTCTRLQVLTMYIYFFTTFDLIHKPSKTLILTEVEWSMYLRNYWAVCIKRARWNFVIKSKVSRMDWNSKVDNYENIKWAGCNQNITLASSDRHLL